MEIIHTVISHISKPPISHILTILTVFLLTYIRILGKKYFWVIDDLEGLTRFSETFQKEHKKAPDGKTRSFDELDYDKFVGEVIREKKIDSYDVDTGKKDKDNKPITRNVKFLSFIPELGFPGNVLRFLRLHIGKEFCEIAKNKKGHPVYGFRQSPRRHHIFSMVVQMINLTLGYLFLSRTVGHDVAFGACLLYSVYPLTVWTVGWISGVPYSLSLMFTLIALNLTGLAFILEILLVMLLAFLSTICLYVGAFTWTIFILLGMPWHALAYFVVGMAVLAWKGIETKNYRVKNFKEQSMEITTKFNWRKPIVMVKTFAYYLGMVFLPLKMGLYHVWGYHYDESIERFDKMFFWGLVGILVSGVSFYFGALPIKLGIVWFVSYWIIFCNLITAMQFVGDRYAVIPGFGICIILSYLFHDTPILWVILGLYAMRTYLFLPTYLNEIDFYSSNFQNFRKSEVALGNLGVAYINQGMPGAAVDMWMLATRINPLYDVPWYNLYSVFRGNGRLQEAYDFLNRCLNAKVVHFRERWEKERDEMKKILDSAIQVPVVGKEQQQMILNSAGQAFVAKDTKTELFCLKEFLRTGTDGIHPEMISQVTKRITELEASSALQLCNPGEGPERS